MSTLPRLLHGMAIRSPWYVCERGGYDRFDPRAAAPALQMYDSEEFVDRLLADPRDSLTFSPAVDTWGFPVAVPAAERGEGRLRFATHRVCRTGLRKLYQPSHQRFYVVVVELYCDQPGLPRPGPADEVTVGMVVRRRDVQIASPRPYRTRRVARDLARYLLAEQTDSGLGKGGMDPDVEQVLDAELAAGVFEPPPDLSVTLAESAWLVGPGGRARWHPVAAGDERRLQSGADPELHELELPMWRIPPAGRRDPPAGGSCDRARTRSLWFGLVPTYSADRSDLLDAPRPDMGAPRLDDLSIYQVRCFTRRTVPGREHCPPVVSVSEPSEGYRLAPYFDPEGTSNRSISISMPDLRALSAHAGKPGNKGGAVITSPPGSQLSFPDSGGIPDPGSGSAGGAVPRVCTFAIELFTIVAFFLFSLFLPIVVFIFQLWWLLALRFCLPPSAEAMARLTAYFGGPGPGNTLATLPPNLQTDLDRVLGIADARTKLIDPQVSFPVADADDLVGAIDTDGFDDLPPGKPESRPDDPLCPPPPPRAPLP